MEMNTMGKAKIIGAVGLALLLAGPAQGQGFLEKLDKATGGLSKQLGIGGGSSAASLSNAEIGNGLREALRVGTERLTGQLGRANCFNNDPEVHIPLPASLRKVQSTLKRFGMSGMADDLELRLNRAAEEATPKAKKNVLGCDLRDDAGRRARHPQRAEGCGDTVFQRQDD